MFTNARISRRGGLSEGLSLKAFAGKCFCPVLLLSKIIDWHSVTMSILKRTRLHRAPHLFALVLAYRNTSALYPHLGAFHLSAATCSRYSDRTFQLAWSCALGPHKRLRIPRADLEVLGQANRGATSSSIVRVHSLGLPVTGRKIKRLVLS